MEAGLPVWQLQTDTPPGSAVAFVLRLSEPVAKGAPRVPEQPLARSLGRRVTLAACS